MLRVHAFAVIFLLYSLGVARRRMVPAPTTSILADRPTGATDDSLFAMVHWQDPEVIVYVFFIYEQIAVFLLGFYGCAPFFLLRYMKVTSFLAQDPVLWSTYIEWELITRKRAFRVVHIPWLLARYVMLSALLFLCVCSHPLAIFTRAEFCRSRWSKALSPEDPQLGSRVMVCLYLWSSCFALTR